MDKNVLARFIKAQESDYEEALREIKAGRKTSHWMWYIFPQLRGLGTSGISEYYGISGLDESKAYLGNEYLRGNLVQVCEALMEVTGRSAVEIFSYPDVAKLRSSMTLFAIASEDCSNGSDVFSRVLRKYFRGDKDRNTIRML